MMKKRGKNGIMHANIKSKQFLFLFFKKLMTKKEFFFFLGEEGKEIKQKEY